MNELELIDFSVTMQLPQDYIDALESMAAESNMTADQLTRNCVAVFLRNYHPRGLTDNNN